MSKPATLRLLHDRDGRDAAVVVHGIRQSARGVSGFAGMLAEQAPGLDVHVFDYDWTRGLKTNGLLLAKALEDLRHRRVALVGYSMGGLVARMAASFERHGRVETVVTLATPNRGALTTAQLVPLGQDLMDGVRFISPLARCPGVIDLTRAPEVMEDRRRDPEARANVASKRYASVPALYFHEHRHWRAADTAMGPLGVFFSVSTLTRVPRPHDGIVCEASNDLVNRRSTDFAEFDFAEYRQGLTARCHAVHVEARELDHMTVLRSEEIARLVASLATLEDWSELKPDRDLNLYLA